MDRARAAAEDLRHVAGDFDPGHLFVRIHGRRSRCKKKVGSACFSKRTVLFKRPGVGVIVFIRAELGRIDEDGRDDDVVFLSGGTDEGSVSLMESAHGCYESDGFSFFFTAADEIFQFANFMADNHHYSILSGETPEGFSATSGNEKERIPKQNAPKWGSGYEK